MRIILLKDLSSGFVDGVIVADVSTTGDIENAISKAKENPDYTWEDLCEALPDDCILYDRWNDLETVYY